MKSIITFLILTIFCSRSSYSQSSSWTTTNKWVYKNGEKFFPIGIWYPRGYDPSSPYTIIEDNEEILNLPNQRTRKLNPLEIIFVQLHTF
jgi:hypothetical protein